MKPLYYIQVWCSAGCVTMIQDALMSLREEVQKDNTTSEMIHGVTTTRSLAFEEMEEFDKKHKESK